MAQKRPSSERDPEDATQCSICFENCHLTGDHRLVSLKCGHVFGDRCIRRQVM